MPYRQATVADLPAIALFNDAVELIAIPGAGARITHLRRRAGREWLWRNGAIPFRTPPAASPTAPDAYVTGHDSGGWDECFPTIAAGELPGDPPIRLPDHGELWHATWQHDLLASAEATTWRSTTTCRTVPAEFSRLVSIGAGEVPMVTFEYRLRSLGTGPLSYLWAAHPLFNIQPGSRLELVGVSHARVAAVHGRDDWHAGQELSWPTGGGSAWEVPRTGGWAAKLFFAATGRASARLQHPAGGEALELQWDAAEVPALGLWLNCGGWAPGGQPYWNLAIEPTLAPIEGITPEVPGAGMAPILPPDGERSWRVTVTLREDPF